MAKAKEVFIGPKTKHNYTLDDEGTLRNWNWAYGVGRIDAFPEEAKWIIFDVPEAKDMKIQPPTIIVPVRCDAINLWTGKQCTRITKITGPYCWQHTVIAEGVRVKESKIPGAGLGLFAEMEFRVGDYISRYAGRIYRSIDEFEAQYSPWNAPVYAAEFGTRDEPFTVDAVASTSGNARYICDGAIGQGDRPLTNCQFQVDAEARANSCKRVVCTKDIKAGEEIYINYGPDYWWAMDLQKRFREGPGTKGIKMAVKQRPHIREAQAKAFADRAAKRAGDGRLAENRAKRRELKDGKFERDGKEGEVDLDELAARGGLEDMLDEKYGPGGAVKRDLPVGAFEMRVREAIRRGEAPVVEEEDILPGQYGDFTAQDIRDYKNAVLRIRAKREPITAIDRFQYLVPTEAVLFDPVDDAKILLRLTELGEYLDYDIVPRPRAASINQFRVEMRRARGGAAMAPLPPAETEEEQAAVNRHNTISALARELVTEPTELVEEPVEVGSESSEGAMYDEDGSMPIGPVPPGSTRAEIKAQILREREVMAKDDQDWLTRPWPIGPKRSEIKEALATRLEAKEAKAPRARAAPSARTLRRVMERVRQIRIGIKHPSTFKRLRHHAPFLNLDEDKDQDLMALLKLWRRDDGDPESSDASTASDSR